MPVQKVRISRIVNTYPGVPGERVEMMKEDIASKGECTYLLPCVKKGFISSSQRRRHPLGG
jgi:hypothetical protein